MSFWPATWYSCYMDGINDKHRLTLHLAFESSKSMISIDQQHMNLDSCTTSFSLDPHFKKDLVSNPGWWQVWIYTTMHS